MNKSARRALQATAAVAGMATALGVPGTALAATPSADGLAQQQAPAPSALPGGAAPSASSVDNMHTFALPRAVPADNEVPEPEDASSARDYTKDEDDEPGYDQRYNTDDDRKAADAAHDEGDAEYPNCEPKGEGDYSSLGYNGNKDDDGEYDSDDYDPECTGYHAPRGANANDNEGYNGSDESRRGNSSVFGGLI